MELLDADILWAARRLPKNLRHLMLEVGPQLIVAGGYLRACIAGEPVNDVDCFAPSKELAKEWAEKMCKKPHESDNAFTCRGQRYTIQFIHRWTYDSPMQILQSFDFTVAMAAMYFQPTPARKFVGICHDSFYQDLAAKRLVYTSPQRNEDAGGSVLRVLKFYQKGYRMPLDSFAATISRLVAGGVDMEVLMRAAHTIAGEEKIDLKFALEKQLTKVLTGLLKEVDPNVDPEHLYHLPTKAEQDATGKQLTEPEGEEAEG